MFNLGIRFARMFYAYFKRRLCVCLVWTKYDNLIRFFAFPVLKKPSRYKAENKLLWGCRTRKLAAVP